VLMIGTWKMNVNLVEICTVGLACNMAQLMQKAK
jgi:hypothetical protein